MSATKRILVIDDDKRFSFGLVAVLRRAGFQVTTAYDGAEGLAAIRRDAPDVILCDIMMPPPNGIQIKKELMSDPTANRTPFLFLTARTAQVDKVTGLEIGADDYITKPFEVNELLARIQAILRREEWGYQKGVDESNIAISRLRNSISTSISHEMRTPLTKLLNTLEFVLHEKFTENNNELADYVNRANDGARRLQFLIEDLEMLTDIDQDNLNNFRQRIDLRSLLNGPVNQVLRIWDQKTQDFQVEISPDTVIYAPTRDFGHVVAHLLDNACKFSPKDSRIQFVLKSNGLGGVILEIQDSGGGISPDLREKVFERYYQKSQGDARVYGGLGVGLTISRAFARNLGGDVEVVDNPIGCRVRLTLPAYRQEESQE